MRFWLYLTLYFGIAAGLASCHPAAQPQAMTASPGNRIVSIDYCADQMLLGLVPKARIAAVSVDADSDPLFAAPRAIGLPRVRADVERVLAYRPSLVIRSYGGGPRMEAALRRAGIPVFTLPYADDIASVRATISASGAALNAHAAADRRLAELDAALSSADASVRPISALYVTPGDVTTGPDSLVAKAMAAAGLVSYDQRPGWHRLPVERLLAQPPRLVVRGFFDSAAHRQDHWSSSSHHALRRALANVPQVDVPGSEIACGNWLLGQAVRRMAAQRQAIQP